VRGRRSATPPHSSLAPVVSAPAGGAFRGELDAPNSNCGFLKASRSQMRGAGAAPLRVLLGRGDIGVPCLSASLSFGVAPGYAPLAHPRPSYAHTRGVMQVSNSNDFTSGRFGPCDVARCSSVHTGSEVGVAPGGVEPPPADSKFEPSSDRPRPTETNPLCRATPARSERLRSRPISVGLVAPPWPLAAVIVLRRGHDHPRGDGAAGSSRSTSGARDLAEGRPAQCAVDRRK
jgi:hypothetical protein